MSSLSRNMRHVLYKGIPKFVLGVLAILFYCEFLIYYLTQIQCSWPTPREEPSEKQPVRVLVLAEPRLLGRRDENTFYNIYQEWQMERTFQTAMTLHQPELVFILGDLFEDGINCTNTEFIESVHKFKQMFKVPSGTSLYVVAGDHDIGHHNRITPHTAERFERRLSAAPARLVSRRGAHFVLLNSMALQGDGCMLCARAQDQIDNITDILKCSTGSELCKGHTKLEDYSRPIIVQHFPLHRGSSSACASAAGARGHVSREATAALAERLRPRAALAAHPRRCAARHRYAPTRAHATAFTEHTVPPFAPRLAPDIEYYLMSVSGGAVSLARCAGPGALGRGTGAALALALLLWLRGAGAAAAWLRGWFVAFVML